MSLDNRDCGTGGFGLPLLELRHLFLKISNYERVFNFNQRPPHTAPLAACPPDLLSTAEESLARVEVEVALRELRPEAQEGLQEAELRPGRLDELVPVHNVNLIRGEYLQPPGMCYVSREIVG